MGPFGQKKSSLDRILWVVIFIGMVASSLGGKFSLGSFFLMPVPLIILNVLISPVNAGVLILGASAVFAVEEGIAGGVAFFLLIGVFSQLLGFMIRRNSRVSRILFWGVVFLMAVGLILISLAGINGVNGTLTLLNSVAENLKAAILSSAYGNNFTAEDLSGFFPFFVLYLIFIFNASNFFLSRWVLHNKGIPVIPLGNLSEFQLPQHIAGGAVFLTAMGYGLKMAGWNGGPELVDTILYLTAFVFMFQGLAVCSFFMKQFAIPSAWQTLILTALMLLAGPIGLGLAGLTDVIMDLRKQRRKGGNQDESKSNH